MKIQVLSDLHVEFQADYGKSLIASLNKNCDVLCCAGDLATPQLLEDSLRRLCDVYPQVVFVLGNHSFYGSSFNAMFDKMNRLSGKIKNLHWLENRDIKLNGQHFVGATLWFERQHDSLDYKFFLADFMQIKDFERLVFGKFAISKSFLAAKIRSDSVVITHHLPSFKCVDKQFYGSKYNIYFASDLDDVIKETKPKIFISGHTHCSYDFMMGRTRMVCNPFGYAGNEINPNFNDNLIITI